MIKDQSFRGINAIKILFLLCITSSILLVLPLSAYDIVAPVTLTDANEYRLTNDVLNSSVSGIVISGSNIILDGNGHIFTGLGKSSGISINGNNNKIKNLSVKNFSYGIYIKGSNNILENFEIPNNLINGISSEGSNNIIENCEILNNLNHGVSSIGSNNILENCEISNNLNHGIYAEGSIQIYNSSILGNSNHGLNILVSPGSSKIYIKNTHILQNSQDAVHIEMPHPENNNHQPFDDINISNNEILNNKNLGIYSKGYIKNVVVEQNKISANGNGGINLNRVSYTSYNYVYYLNPSAVSLLENTIQSNKFGISTQQDSGQISGNTIINNTDFGIQAGSGSLIYNNEYNNIKNINGVAGANSWNVTKVQGTNIINGPWIAGNYYAQPDGKGFSQTCNDSDGDGICDIVYPIGFYGNMDYYPLSPLKPLADFTGSPLSGSVPLTVQFTDQSKYEPTQWLWNFGDNETSLAQNPTHTFSSIGTYTITLTVSNDKGSNTITKTNMITVSESPTPTNTVTPSPTITTTTTVTITPTASITPSPTITSTETPTTIVTTVTPTSTSTITPTVTATETATTTPTITQTPTQTIFPTVTSTTITPTITSTSTVSPTITITYTQPPTTVIPTVTVTPTTTVTPTATTPTLTPTPSVFTINATATIGGTITPSGIISVIQNQNKEFSIVPDSCYDISDVLVDGVSVGKPSTYIFTNINTNHIINAKFVKKEYQITSVALSGGTISPLGQVMAKCGESITFTITPAPCSEISDVIVDGQSVGKLSSYTFTDVRGSHIIIAQFSSKTFIISATSGPNGIISPSGQVSTICGINQTFTFTPSQCYAIADVVVDGLSKGKISSYTFTDINAAHTINALFEPRLYSITANAAEHGTITPSGVQNYPCGAEKRYDISPEWGYVIRDVAVDGSSVGALSSYTFSKIDKDHTISAYFETVPSGSIRISSEPEGADIYIDKTYRSKTNRFISGIASGRHELLLKYPFYQDYIATIDVDPSGSITVPTINLIPVT